MRNLHQQGRFTLNTRDGKRELTPSDCTELVNLYPGEVVRPIPADVEVFSEVLAEDPAPAMVPPAVIVAENKGEPMPLFWQKRDGSYSLKGVKYGADILTFQNYITVATSEEERVDIALVQDRAYCTLNGHGLTMVEPLDGELVAGAAMIRELPAVITQPEIAGAAGLEEGTYAYLLQYVRLSANSDGFDAGAPVATENYSTPEMFGALGAPFLYEVASPFASAVLNVSYPSEEYHSRPTHVRIWRSTRANSFEDARGAGLHYVTDYPWDFALTNEGMITLMDTMDNKRLSSSVKLQEAAFSFQEVNPVVMAVEFHEDRLWYQGFSQGLLTSSPIPGSDGSPNGSLEPKAYWGLVDPATVIEYHPEQEDRGLVSFGDMLVVFKERCIGAIRGDDATKPITLRHDMGNLFPHAAIVADTQLGEILLFLSTRGPAMFTAGNGIELVEDFTAGELWPQHWDEQWVRENRERVHSAFFDNCWIVQWGEKTFGYRLVLNQNQRGTFEIRK